MKKKIYTNKMVLPNGTEIPVLPGAETLPIDVAISRHIQNMMATYGEAKVRASITELFGIKIDKVPKAG